MDVAVAVFNVGAGLGVLAAGLALAYLAWRVTPLIGESRALVRDVRRVARDAEEQLGPILDRARQLTDSMEVLSEDMAVRLDRWSDLLSTLEDGLAGGRITVAAGRPEALPVESAQTREGAPDT